MRLTLAESALLSSVTLKHFLLRKSFETFLNVLLVSAYVTKPCRRIQWIQYNRLCAFHKFIVLRENGCRRKSVQNQTLNNSQPDSVAIAKQFPNVMHQCNCASQFKDNLWFHLDTINVFHLFKATDFKILSVYWRFHICHANSGTFMALALTGGHVNGASY